MALPRSMKRPRPRGARTKLHNQLTETGHKFLDEIAAIRVLDPACGSGNFLYVALRQLLDLQKEVIDYAFRLGSRQLYPSVEPDQVLGIEINGIRA